MPTVPPEPESVVVMVADDPSDPASPSVASAAWTLGEGWHCLVTMRAVDGVAHVQAVALEPLGQPTVSQLDDILQERNEAWIDRPTPPVEFRYRWVRDIGQQYETALRDVMTGRVRSMAWLANPSAFSRRPARPRARRGPAFYAEIARLYVKLGGSLHALAEHEYVSWSTAKEWVSRATREGFLTSPGKGRRGARQLTPAAEAILREG